MALATGSAGDSSGNSCDDGSGTSRDAGGDEAVLLHPGGERLPRGQDCKHSHGRKVVRPSETPPAGRTLCKTCGKATDPAEYNTKFSGGMNHRDLKNL